MNIHEMAELLHKHGIVTLDHAGRKLTLDMRHRHERLYAIKRLTGIEYPQADIDTELTKRFVKLGDRVLDAGANIGYTALEFIDAGAAHVTALEPVSALFSRLEQLRSDQLEPRKLALAGDVGKASIFVSEGHNQGSSLSQAITEYFPSIFGSTIENVDVTTIDTLSEADNVFDVWKLDIEGAEVAALRGAVNTFTKHPPRIILAEVFDPFFAEFVSELPDTYAYRRRAYLGEENGELILQPLDRAIERPVHHHSPMYVFGLQDDS